MNLMPIPDIGWIVPFLVFGIEILVYVIPLTILAETFVIQHTLNISPWRAVRDAVITNLLSGIAGFYLNTKVDLYVHVSVRDAYGSPELSMMFPPDFRLFRLLVILCVASIVMEGVVLVLLENSHPRKKVWLATLIGNLLTYTGLFVFFILMSFVPGETINSLYADVICGVGILKFTTPLTILVGVFVFRNVLNISPWRAVRDSIIVNLLSGIAGFYFITTISFYNGIQGQEAAAYIYLPLVLALFCASSIVVGGILLKRLENSHPREKVWRAILFSNLPGHTVALILSLCFWTLIMYSLPPK